MSILEQMDAERDFIIRGINHTIQSASFSSEGSVKGAGEAVSKVFEKYGVGVALENYAIETSLIAAFLKDVGTEQMKVAVQVVPYLEDLIKRLVAAQHAFEVADNAWNLVKSNKTTTASTLKKELFNIINNQIVTYLTALSGINPDYKDIAIEINEIIATANRTVTRKKSDSVEEPTDTPRVVCWDDVVVVEM